MFKRLTPFFAALALSACTLPIGWQQTVDDAHASYHCGQWASEALEAGWPIQQVPKLLRTIRRESLCIPSARSGTNDSSLLQINDIVLRDMAQRPHLWSYAINRIGHIPTVNELLHGDPIVGLIVGYNLWLIDGWRPWRGGA